jgi:hypothetical protein
MLSYVLVCQCIPIVKSQKDTFLLNQFGAYTVLLGCLFLDDQYYYTLIITRPSGPKA